MTNQSKSLRMLGAAIALGAVLGLAGCEQPLGPSTSPERISAAFDQEMTQTASLAPWREEMQRDFPAVYDQMRQAFVGHIQAGETRAEAMDAALAVIHDYRRVHQKAIPRASQDTLLALAALNLEGMNLMRKTGDAACARYVMTSNVQGGAADQLLIVAKRGAMTFRAIHEGETAPVQRAPLDPAELAAFRAALMAKGLGPDLVEKVFEGGLEGLSLANQCKVGGGIVDALATLPPATAAKLTAALAANNS